MNLNKLSTLQAELDNHISMEKIVDHKDFMLEKAMAACVELGELLNERPFIFKYWSRKEGDRDKALTEYVDVLHFLISYGNASGFDFKSYEYNKPDVHDQRVLILGLFVMFGSLPQLNQFEDALNHFLLLAEKLQFSFEEIEQAYSEKNKENHIRQENNY